MIVDKVENYSLIQIYEKSTFANLNYSLMFSSFFFFLFWFISSHIATIFVYNNWVEIVNDIVLTMIWLHSVEND